jgi:hypothetical protein
MDKRAQEISELEKRIKSVARTPKKQPNPREPIPLMAPFAQETTPGARKIKTAPQKKLSPAKIIAHILLVVAIIVPPWEQTIAEQSTALITKPAGYTLIFTPPPAERHYSRGMRISLVPYIGQISIPFIYLVLMYSHNAVFRRKPKI